MIKNETCLNECKFRWQLPPSHIFLIQCLFCLVCNVWLQVPFKDEFLTEMKFILKFEGNTKVVRHRKSESIDSQHSVTSYPSNESGIHHTDRSEKSIRDKWKRKVLVFFSLCHFSPTSSPVLENSIHKNCNFLMLKLRPRSWPAQMNKYELCAFTNELKQNTKLCEHFYFFMSYHH